MFSNSCRRPARDGHLTAVTAPVLQLFACHKLLALSFKREKLEKKKKAIFVMWGAGSFLRSLLHPSEKWQLPGEQGNPKGCEQQGHPGLDRRKGTSPEGGDGAAVQGTQHHQLLPSPWGRDLLLPPSFKALPSWLAMQFRCVAEGRAVQPLPTRGLSTLAQG